MNNNFEQYPPPRILLSKKEIDWMATNFDWAEKYLIRFCYIEKVMLINRTKLFMGKSRKLLSSYLYPSCCSQKKGVQRHQL